MTAPTASALSRAVPPRTEPDARERGFTLIEILTVILIVGMLATIAIPVFLNQRKKAVDASLRQDVVAMAKLQAVYAADQGVQGLETAATVAGGSTTVGSGTVFHASSGNVVDVSLNSTGTGHCVFAYNPKASDPYDGAPATALLTYNSATGGLGQPCT